MSATASFSVTLTYGRVDNKVHHAHSVALFYSDVQKYVKLLRYHGYVVRYFLAGEFGGLKGRTHWHLILHFYGAVPPHVEREDFIHEAIKANGKPVTDKSGRTRYFWPHGFSFWKKAHRGSVRYAAKYALKDVDDLENQSLLQMTKNPPLGAIYFKEMARAAARQGVALHDASYSFADVRRQDGTRKKYMLRGRTEEIFVQEYIDEYWLVWRKAPPKSQYLEEWDQGWKKELRRISERRKERVGRWGVKDHFNHHADQNRRREIEQKRREEAEDQVYLQLSEPAPKRGPRDLDEWQRAFEKEWVIYGAAKQRQQWRPEPEQHLLGEFHRVWEEQRRKRHDLIRKLWAECQPDRQEFDNRLRKLDAQEQPRQRPCSEFEQWIEQRRKPKAKRR